MTDSSFWHNPLPMIEAPPHCNDHPPTVRTSLPIWSVVVGMFLCYTASCTCGITALLIDNVWDGLPKWTARYTQCRFWWPWHLLKRIQGHRLVAKGTGEHETGNGRYRGLGTAEWWLFADILRTQKRSSCKEQVEEMKVLTHSNTWNCMHNEDVMVFLTLLLRVIIYIVLS